MIVNKPFDIKVIKKIIADTQAIFKLELEGFRIQYKFKNDDNLYSCEVTNEQYRNLKLLPIIQECKIVKNNHKIINSHKEAIEKAQKNEISSIRKLSKIV